MKSIIDLVFSIIIASIGFLLIILLLNTGINIDTIDLTPLSTYLSSYELQYYLIKHDYETLCRLIYSAIPYTYVEIYENGKLIHICGNKSIYFKSNQLTLIIANQEYTFIFYRWKCLRINLRNKHYGSLYWS